MCEKSSRPGIWYTSPSVELPESHSGRKDLPELVAASLWGRVPRSNLRFFSLCISSGDMFTGFQLRLRMFGKLFLNILSPRGGIVILSQRHCWSRIPLLKFLLI